MPVVSGGRDRVEEKECLLLKCPAKLQPGWNHVTYHELLA